MKTAPALILCLLLAAAAMAQPKPDYRRPGAPVPPFVIEQLDGRLLTNGILKKGRPVVLAIFSPRCGHCALALDSLQRLGLTNVHFVLVTEAIHRPYLKDFLSTHGYDKAPAFRHVGVDKGNLIDHIYAYGMLPQFNIYNEQHTLVKTFTGIFPIDSLKVYLH
jgi:glutaredoxin-related protein